MSEFKFACPVCGQHITADSSASGSQLDCPTCFRKIVVPQVSAESKFVLAASEVSKPRTIPQAEPISSAPSPKQNRSALPVVIGFVALAIVASALMIFLRSRNTGGQKQADTTSRATNAVSQPETSLKRHIPAGTNIWMLDLTDAEFPSETAFGRVRGFDFVCDRAVLQGGALHMRMGREWPPDLGLSVILFAHEAQELSGKSVVVNTNNVRSPRVVLRWKEGSTNQTEIFTNNFALKLEFGALKGNRIPGKIYLCTPDEAQSTVAGVFNAEVKKPSSPKPKPN